MFLRYHVAVCVYCLSCVSLYNLLNTHYNSQCTSWIAIGESGYCSLIRKTLGALQTSPLVVAGAVIGGAPLHHAPRRQNVQISQ